MSQFLGKKGALRLKSGPFFFFVFGLFSECDLCMERDEGGKLRVVK